VISHEMKAPAPMMAHDLPRQCKTLQRNHRPSAVAYLLHQRMAANGRHNVTGLVRDQPTGP